MCGIVGYVGNKKAKEVLINGLLSLEYRGYDSAGLAIVENNEIVTMKEKGRVANLEALPGIDKLEGNVGIAHTRWATHGKPSKENAHPQLDNSKTFAVVHNGIIENYADLKKFLNDNGYTFSSQTDTEVIPNLVHHYFSSDKSENTIEKFLRAVKNAISDLRGSYAVEVLSSLYPNNIIVVRKDSPLVLGKGNGENFVCSDIPGMLRYTKEFYLLDDNEFALIGKDKINFYDANLNIHNKEVKNIEWDASSAEKNGYEDYMLKEIFEQPTAIRETIGSRFKLGENCSFDDIEISSEYLKSINKIFIVACGTAMHAGLVGKAVIEKLCRIPTEVDIASEFRYRDPIIDEKTLKGIEACSKLAPLHNPAAILGIKACQKAMPGVPMVAAFDTAFHQTMPKENYLYPIPYEYYEKYGIRKYGAHGTSHKYVTQRVEKLMNKDIKALKIVTCHLGQGASLCAVQGGKSVDTSMGLTPLGGITMVTRSGDLDPSVVTAIMKKENLTADEVESILNKKSGLTAVSKLVPDFREIENASNEGNEDAIIAINKFVSIIAQYIARYAAVMEGIDAVVFTGGIGENQFRIRSKICKKLKFMGLDLDEEKNNEFRSEGKISKEDSKVEIWVVPTDEELMIAQDTLDLIK